MNQRDFTKNIAILISEMVANGDQPIGDYWKRSTPEQKRMFDEKLSKCDGTIRISKHQQGKAVDIYLCRDNGTGGVIVDYTWDKDKSIKYHNRWVELGGNPLVVFTIDDSMGNPLVIADHPHFEG